MPVERPNARITQIKLPKRSTWCMPPCRLTQRTIIVLLTDRSYKNRPHIIGVLFVVDNIARWISSVLKVICIGTTYTLFPVVLL